MNILIISQYCTYPNFGFNIRSYQIAESASRDNNVCLCISSFHHRLIHKEHQKSKEGYLPNLNILSLRTFRYNKSNSIIRVINWFYFGLRLIFLSKKKIGFVPKYIIYSSPSLIGFFGAFILSLKYKCKIYFEVRDIWPLTFNELGKVSKFNPLYIIHQLIEDFAYKYSDGVISTLSKLPEYISSRTGNKDINFHFSPNGFNKDNICDRYSDNNSHKQIIDKIKELKKSGKHVISYCGGIAKSNAIDLYIDLAKSCNNKDLIWLCIGDGPCKESLQKKCKNQKINNIIFFNSINAGEIMPILQSSDILFLANQFLDIYKYGVSPIKLPEYIKSGSKIIHVTNSKNNFLINKNYKIINTDDISEINKQINNFLFEKVEESFDNELLEKLHYKKITKNLLKFIENGNCSN